MPSRLETFPTEIQVLLLCQLDSIATLFSLLRASPTLLQVYRESRDIVYPNIVHNQITPELIQDAVLALKLRHPRSGRSPAVFAQIFHRSVNVSRLSIAEWKLLFQFQSLIERSIQDLTQTTLHNLCSRAVPEDSHHVPANLSDCEHYRLVRAFYNRERLASICNQYFYAVSDDLPDAEEYFQYHGSFLATWSLYEFEEVFFVNHWVRKRLVRFIDQAEDDRFEEWKASGPYKWRYDFENNEDWIWSRVLQDQLTDWLSNHLYRSDLIIIDQITHESEPIARIKWLEHSGGDWYTREHWLRLEGQLRHYRALAVQQLTSPLLPPDWRLCEMTEMDYAGCQFADVANGPNLGLLWGCRKSTVTRPSFPLLDGMATWGAAVWDSERLQGMDILASNPDDVRRSEAYYWHGNIDREKPTVEDRVSDIERKWVAQGLTLDTWNRNYNPTGR